MLGIHDREPGSDTIALGVGDVGKIFMLNRGVVSPNFWNIPSIAEIP